MANTAYCDDNDDKTITYWQLALRFLRLCGGCFSLQKQDIAAWTFFPNGNRRGNRNGNRSGNRSGKMQAGDGGRKTDDRGNEGSDVGRLTRGRGDTETLGKTDAETMTKTDMETRGNGQTRIEEQIFRGSEITLGSYSKIMDKCLRPPVLSDCYSNLN